jgi:hypothetical protein
MGRRPAGRRLYLLGLVGAVASGMVANAGSVVDSFERWHDGVRFHGVVAMTMQVATGWLLKGRELLLPGMAVYVMTRDEVRARFVGRG